MGWTMFLLLQAKHVTLVVVFGVNTSKRPCACGYIGCGGFGVGWDVSLHCDCNHIVRSLALPHIRHATLLHVLLHFHTNVMLLHLLLHFHTYVMLCCCTFSCTSTHTSCYPAAHVMLCCSTFSCTSTHTSCCLLHVLLPFHTYVMLVGGSSVHVKSGSFVHVRRWSSVHVFVVWFCHCISVTWFFLLLFFFTSSHNSSLCGFFLTSLCGVFVFRLVFRAFSFSSCVAPPLTQLYPSCLTQRTQLISHNSSPLTTYITHLTQLISHNSTHTTLLTQLISHNSTHSRAAFVWHLVELLSCPLTELHPSSFTQLISHNSFHLTTHTLISHNSTHSRAAFV